MKTHHTDEQIQAAIDAACEETAKKHTVYLNSLDITPNSSSWVSEAPARRDLLKFALARLPEPTPPVSADGKTPGDIAYDAFINGSDSWESAASAASAVLAAFGQPSLEAAIARMEAVGYEELNDGKYVTMGVAEQLDRIRARLIAAARDGQGEAVDWKAKYEECDFELCEFKAIASRATKSSAEWQARAEKAEAELANWHKELSAVMPTDFKDWHQNSKAEWPLVARQVIENLREREKLAWENVLPHLRPIAEAGDVPEGCVRVRAWMDDTGKWFYGWQVWEGDTHFADIRLPSPAARDDSQPAEADPPSWQPAVGDTVRLKSGGPVMTVAMISLMPGNDVRCIYITDEAKVCIVPAACITPAKEAQP